jgi:formylglycine-generating enzyme required for sulfatase activity
VLKKHRLNDSEKRQLVEGILQGIGHLHNEGIIHRDLKSGNILVKHADGHWIPQITDFGLSRLAETDASFSNSSIGISYAFAAPEQIKGGTVHKNIDLWAVGTIIYHILTGKLPFTAEGFTDTNSANLEISRKITNRVLPPDFQALPQPYKAIIERCWVMEPANRVQKAEELMGLLQNEKNSRQQPLEETIREGNVFKKCANGHYYQGEECPYCSKVETVAELTTPEQLARQGREHQQARQGNDIEMVMVEGGRFMMGSPASEINHESDDVQHQVTLSSFQIGKYEVTQAQWKAIMGSNPSHFKGDELPVERVRWDDVQEFIRKLSAKTGKQYRLPTEAEWEFAARGGNKSGGTKYSGSYNMDNVGWYDKNSGRKTHPVGRKSPNELGIYDMSGNVWEWCSDWYGEYSSSLQANPKGAISGLGRVLRGGSWGDTAPYCRVASRNSSTPSSRFSDYGFRLVLL